MTLAEVINELVRLVNEAMSTLRSRTGITLTKRAEILSLEQVILGLSRLRLLVKVRVFPYHVPRADRSVPFPRAERGLLLSNKDRRGATPALDRDGEIVWDAEVQAFAA